MERQKDSKNNHKHNKTKQTKKLQRTRHFPCKNFIIILIIVFQVSCHNKARMNGTRAKKEENYGFWAGFYRVISVPQYK